MNYTYTVGFAFAVTYLFWTVPTLEASVLAWFMLMLLKRKAN